MTAISWWQKSFYAKETAFINHWKLSQNCYYRYKYIVYKYNYTCRDLTKKGISHPCFYGDLINIAKIFKSDTSNLVKYMKNLIRKGYDLTTIVNSLMQVYFAKKIDILLINLANK